jgi:hypothetical protein
MELGSLWGSIREGDFFGFRFDGDVVQRNLERRRARGKGSEFCLNFRRAIPQHEVKLGGGFKCIGICRRSLRELD